MPNKCTVFRALTSCAILWASMYLSTDYSKKTHKILWEDPRDAKGEKIIFTGVPFVILGRKIYDCQHGVDRKAREKRIRKEEFATDLCHGLDPTNRSYDQTKMREHYVSCLESRRITHFPLTTRRVPYHLDTKKIVVPIFCECRLPSDNK